MKDPLIKIYGWFEIPRKTIIPDTINNTQQNFSKKNHSPHTTNVEICLDTLHKICEEWYLDTEIFTLDNNMIHISYEGDYFPHEEVAQTLTPYISKNSKGKLDVIDLEAWTLTRFFLDAEHNQNLLQNAENVTNPKEENTLEQVLLPYFRKSSLNHALEAAQEKNGASLKI